MALIDIYRKYMYGMPGSVDTGSEATKGTKGLIGFGGEMGGGLLNTFEQPDTQGLFNTLSNPFVGIGAMTFGAGQRGQTPGMAIGDSVMQGLKFSETAARLGKAQKKRKLIAEYADKVPAEDKEIFEIAPELYIQTKLKTKLEKPTLSREVLAVYNKMKGKTGEDFDTAYAALSKAEKSLYKNKIEGNTNAIDELIKSGIESQNTAVVLDSMPDEKLLKSNQLYQIKDKFYRWDGQNMIPVPAPK
tara:strand:- start:2083 stop:2817 length:735 start_codon:yes stop_codon:yes gene_type:complete